MMIDSWVHRTRLLWRGLIHFLKLNETQLLKEKKLSITHTCYHAEMIAKKKKEKDEDEKEKGGGAGGGDRALSPPLAGHLALDADYSGARIPVTRTYCCLGLARWIQHWRYREPEGIVFLIPKTTFRVFSFCECFREWIRNAFVSRSRMNLIVWKGTTAHYSLCEPEFFFGWHWSRTFYFYLEVLCLNRISFPHTFSLL